MQQKLLSSHTKIGATGGSVGWGVGVAVGGMGVSVGGNKLIDYDFIL